MNNLFPDTTPIVHNKYLLLFFGSFQNLFNSNDRNLISMATRSISKLCHHLLSKYPQDHFLMELAQSQNPDLVLSRLYTFTPKSQSLEIWYKMFMTIAKIGDLVLVGDLDYADIRINERTNFTIEFIYDKGALLQELPDSCMCKTIIDNTKVHYNELYGIPGVTVKVIEIINMDTLVVKVNEVTKEICNDSELLCENEKNYSITANNANGEWYFCGVFFKYLHTAESLDKHMYSPKFLIPRSEFINGRRSIYFGNDLIGVEWPCA